MIPVWLYLLKLQQIPIFQWSRLALEQTIKQDREDLLLDFLPLDFTGTINESLWFLYSSKKAQKESDWSFQKARLTAAWEKGLDFEVPHGLEGKKRIFKLLRYKLIQAEQQGLSNDSEF